MTNDPTPEASPPGDDRAMIGRAASDRGAVGTEMAILVALLVAAAITIGGIMLNAARNNAECIPTNPSGDVVSSDC